MWKNRLFSMLLGLTGICFLLLTMSANCSTNSGENQENNHNTIVKDAALLTVESDLATIDKQVHKIVKIKGTVVSIYFAKELPEKPTFLNINKAFPENPIAIVIPYSEKDIFQDIEMYKDKNIFVEGTVSLWDYEYGKKPVIIVSRPEQITLAN